MKPRIRDVLVCDDIREEKNGKRILIGVYNDDIVIKDIPAVLATLTFLAKAEGLPEGATPVTFVFETPSGKELVRGQADAQCNDPSRPVRMVLTVGNLILHEPGEHKVKIGFGDERPRICERIAVRLLSEFEDTPKEDKPPAGKRARRPAKKRRQTKVASSKGTAPPA